MFGVTFVLYGLPLQAVLYPTALCLLIGLMFALADFLRVRHRHEALRALQSFTDISVSSLPAADDMTEADYQHIIDRLCREHAQLITDNHLAFSEMVDYYTVWVHQIKTPIASMRLLLQGEDSPTSRALSNDLFRIEQYVEMVLSFLRLGSESTDYVFREYDLDTIVRKAVRKFAGEFISRRLTLVYEPLHATVVTDQKWLSFVIEQVLSNALKYTPKGSITITLTPQKELCIRDTGIGIAAEDLPRIFENGFTGYNGRADQKATGIGLYLCRRICDRLGHKITAQSRIGEGTTVLISLAQRSIEVE